MSRQGRLVVFDLDDTLVRTDMLRPLREARNWRDAVRRISDTVLFDGVAQLLEGLAERDIAWGIVTTSVSYYASAILAHHGLQAPALVAYHDAPPKPSPAGIHLMSQRLGIDLTDAIGVGDALTDLMAYRAAGLRSVGALWSPTLAAGEWDYTAADPLAVLEILDAGHELK